MTKVYYWNKKKNFGDELAPLLLKHFLHIETERSEAEESDIVVVGSILEHLPFDYRGILAGIGSLRPQIRRLPRVRGLLVRGPLTERNLYGHTNVGIGYGDPGLLADELVGDQDKTHHLGIVPHWSDTELAKNPTFLKYNPLIINVANPDPLEVIRQIGRCRKIVSSSLHGIILADAFGIPRRTEIPPAIKANPSLDGGTFKWEDYSASINLPFKIGETQEADRNIIIERQHEIYDVLEEVKGLLQRTAR